MQLNSISTRTAVSETCALIKYDGIIQLKHVFACIQTKIGYYGRHLVFVFHFTCSLLNLFTPFSLFPFMSICTLSCLCSISSLSSPTKIIKFIHFEMNCSTHMGMLDNVRPFPASFVSSSSQVETKNLSAGVSKVSTT